MRIERLSISNHAVVPDLDLPVSDHLVFIGPNETGKSTCLRPLDAVFNGNMAHLYTLLRPENFADVAEPVVCGRPVALHAEHDQLLVLLEMEGHLPVATPSCNLEASDVLIAHRC